jgi:hypothetical protein
VKGVLLRSRDGRRFLVAQLMDSMAGGLSLVVLPWMVLDAGGSRSLAGAAFLIATIPYLVLGLHVSPLAYGVIDGLHTGATAVLRLAGGFVADRIRARRPVTCPWRSSLPPAWA